MIIYSSNKKISCVFVRGSTFCPSTVEFVSKYLNLSTNSMIMGIECNLFLVYTLGTPSENFPFPIGKLNGIRIAVPEVYVKNDLRADEVRYVVY